MALPKAATQTDLDPVRAAYAFADDREVTAFLEEDPFLIPLLEEARGQPAAQFGSDTPVRLEVALDPVNEKDRALVARVETGPLPPRDAVARLGAFYDGWRREQRSAGG